LLSVADPSHIMYGSDWPFTPLAACHALAARIDATPLPAGGLREQVLAGNAVQLLPSLASTVRP
jgi:predicted TIM-barrel fold metal-dependent hydrolase